MKSLKLIIFLFLFVPQISKAEPFLLGAHLLVNSLAQKFLPGYEPTTFHGPFVGINFPFMYERNEPYKIAGDSEGSTETGFGFSGGYHFVASQTHSISLELFRNDTRYKDQTSFEGRDIIDGIGLRFRWKLLVLKAGYANHGFKNEADKYDNGYYTGVGVEIGLGRLTLYTEVTDYFLEDRDKHLAGFDLGLRWAFKGREGGI